MDLPCYHGNISIKTCENLLLRKGKNGCFLLRDSESYPGALCLCVLHGRLIYTYRIFKNIDGHYIIQTAEGVKEKLFTNLKELISNYRKPNQGICINLIYPVNKEPCEQIHLQSKGSMERVILDETYEEIDDRVYVDVLPS
ncbi:LOW QUALITY PROTEIN: SH2 domain-containing protein 1B-like [Bufo bufo]|uniref:LOW QUALITY PROTEIN: SH2 domain-containing protein 1B-like n=1 Tax=Bufo bufo TaxID=8384 RepID=UPI001ABE6B7B|nr:LOW QUALITY PROTEIN: SH2 domain-containing protein 1B-like [Bufo bufo]